MWLLGTNSTAIHTDTHIHTPVTQVHSRNIGYFHLPVKGVGGGHKSVSLPCCIHELQGKRDDLSASLASRPKGNVSNPGQELSMVRADQEKKDRAKLHVSTV
ncbi:hypothetical protein TWF173_002660 [Orbilia oligospora]|nr:hypothetical protein TWF173_002660 [Orbilia oligospora]